MGGMGGMRGTRGTRGMGGMGGTRGVSMMGVMKKFCIASLFMWITPVAILYGFNHNLFPGSTQLSSSSLTLVSGLLAVLSVNLVIVFYIYLALKEPLAKHEPDSGFVAEAKASMTQIAQPENEESHQGRDKQE
ncbi:hypothetical protein Sjap_003643 [Stephania japonica]|uniref:Vacuolar ATPase assembly integral membrane protein VMA21 homolog n=1 Tax=Stephania japonica TaxID=461633 RepID=A0AAP0KP76_9MAGN